MIQIGLECFLADNDALIKGKRLGYLSNQASTDRNYLQGRFRLVEKFGDQITCLFAPQHGFFSEKQDNMIESDHQTDQATGLMVYSLYGTHRKPTGEMFDNLDVLLIDLIDVGTRVYTFMYTMAYCLEAAAEFNKHIIILDRPNPIGGLHVEGNLLKPDCKSFVGLYPIPMRHGLTLGELALYFNSEYNINAQLDVVPMKGYQRDMFFRDCGFPWVAPSPNMVSPETALVYPGQVIWEGTNVSEGRGTTLPFEFVGAPFCRHDEILEQVNKTELPGVIFRPLYFEPTFGKWQGEMCCGFQLHVTDEATFKPYRTSIALLQAVNLLYPDGFEYKNPPYEYEYEKLPLDLILGDRAIRKLLEGGMAIRDIEKKWENELEAYDKKRSRYFLY